MGVGEGGVSEGGGGVEEVDREGSSDGNHEEEAGSQVSVAVSKCRSSQITHIH